MAWNAIAWSEEREQAIYREWGQFLTKKGKLDIADLYYNKSLDINNSDTNALYQRSRCKRTIAQTEQALLDAHRALELAPLRQPFNLEVCDGIYERNQFEDATATLHNYSRKFRGEKVHAFHNRIFVVEEDFSKSLGNSLGYFILENRDYLFKGHAKMLKMNRIDRRPLWKILREERKCDVLSILEKEVERLSPREIARRMREFTIYNQIYLGRSWKDLLFLRGLRTNKNLLLPQSQWSSKLLELLTKAKYQGVLKFLKMLQCRGPLYYVKSVAFPNKKMRKVFTESYLYRVQYQVHRDMLKILKKITHLKALGNVEHLRSYVEGVMGDYVVLKTTRVMPWKFEFVNEVYNLLALALIEDFLDIPTNLNHLPPEDRMAVFLKLNNETDEKVVVQFEFGKRSTYADMDGTDKLTMKHRALETRLEKRIYFAKYPIERVYLWHEIAQCNLLQYRIDKARVIAERAIAEADQIQSKAWKLLSLLLICKTHAILKKLAKIKSVMLEGQKLAKEINNPGLIRFFRQGMIINRHALLAKKAAENQLKRSLAPGQSNADVTNR